MAFWPQPGRSSASAQTSVAASDCLVSSTGYLVIKPLQVRNTWKLNPLVSVSESNAQSKKLFLFVQGWCPVTTSSLLPLAARQNTSAVDPCAATPATSSQCSRSWQDPRLTCERDALKLIHFSELVPVCAK